MILVPRRLLIRTQVSQVDVQENSEVRVVEKMQEHRIVDSPRMKHDMMKIDVVRILVRIFPQVQGVKRIQEQRVAPVDVSGDTTRTVVDNPGVLSLVQECLRGSRCGQDPWGIA